MKAPARNAHQPPAHTRKKVRAYSALIYKAHKEVRSEGRMSPNFLCGRCSFPRPVLLRLVSVEASRLSRSNRLKVITVQEINAAVTLLRQKINARAAA